MPDKLIQYNVTKPLTPLEEKQLLELIMPKAAGITVDKFAGNLVSFEMYENDMFWLLVGLEQDDVDDCDPNSTLYHKCSYSPIEDKTPSPEYNVPERNLAPKWTDPYGF